jgi:transposase
MSQFKYPERVIVEAAALRIGECLPESHLARYIVNVVEQLDVSELEKTYCHTGRQSYHPRLMLGILIYGYVTGTFSSRKLEQATYDSIPFRYIACNLHPDHTSISAFRCRFGEQFKAFFLQVLQIAAESGLSQFGRISTDGTKIHANASRHSALSYGHANKLEEQLKREIEELVKEAEKVDNRQVELNVPDEIARREAQCKVIAAAKATIEARAKVRHEIEKTEYDAKMAAIAAQEAVGKKPRGKKPEAPQDTPNASDQVNLTDEESRIMKVPGGGFEQCYNAQAAVDCDSMLIVSCYATQAANDKQQIEPMLKELNKLPPEIRPEEISADSGFFSEANVKACEAHGIEPYIAVGREGHHPDWKARVSEPAPLPEGATVKQKMQHKLQTQKGRAIYALRKQTVEPVFGIVKSVMGFRQFLLRGLEKVNQEWTLVCLAWNLKRMSVLRHQSVKNA